MAKYLKFPAWTHFWDLNGQLRLYFTQITGASSYKLYKQLMLIFLPLSLIFTLSLTILPLTPFQRHLLSDPSLFFGLSPTFNWIFLIFEGDSLAFHLQLYRPATDILWIIRELLLGKMPRKVAKFTLERAIWKPKGRVQSSGESVRKFMAKYLFTVQYFILLEVGILLFYKVNSLYLIALDWRFFLTTTSGVASLLIIFLVLLSFDTFVLTYTNSHIIASWVFIAFTQITFTQLRKAHCLLGESPLSSLSLGRFTVTHTRMLTLIFQCNAFYGPLLVAFIALQLPSNSYLLLRLLLGHFSRIAGLIFLNFVCVQCLALLVFHALCAAFGSRIHACKGRLFAHQRAKLSLADKLKIDSYLMKFNVRKQYGITYGSIGLITFASFAKFCISYSEIIMYGFTWIQKK